MLMTSKGFFCPNPEHITQSESVVEKCDCKFIKLKVNESKTNHKKKLVTKFIQAKSNKTK